MPASLEAFRPQITKAVGYTNGAYEFEDIQRGLDEGTLQALWLPHSVLIYTIESHPRFPVCNVFLAAGRMEDMARFELAIVEVARIYGCKRITMTGRRGWMRSFLTAESNWKESTLVTLEKEL